MKNLKPMLAGKADESKLIYPLYASHKLDGVRCLTVNGVALSRSLKPIPNKYIQNVLKDFNFLDGELGVGDPTAPDFYRKTVSAVMTEDGEPDFVFYVFDNFSQPNKPFVDRYESIFKLKNIFTFNKYISILNQKIIHNSADLSKYEDIALKEGHEGVILRSVDGPYKFGRSTTNEGYLLKLKRYSDAEAEIVGFEELMHNENVAKTNELGRTARSSHKENLVPAGKLGAFNVRDIESGVDFSIGTGFDDAQRIEYWKNKKKLTGKIVKYKYFEGGSKDAPRFPVFLGFRDKRDM